MRPDRLLNSNSNTTLEEHGLNRSLKIKIYTCVNPGSAAVSAWELQSYVRFAISLAENVRHFALPPGDARNAGWELT